MCVCGGGGGWRVAFPTNTSPKSQDMFTTSKMNSIQTHMYTLYEKMKKKRRKRRTHTSCCLQT